MTHDSWCQTKQTSLHKDSEAADRHHVGEIIIGGGRRRIKSSGERTTVLLRTRTNARSGGKNENLKSRVGEEVDIDWPLLVESTLDRKGG